MTKEQKTCTGCGVPAAFTKTIALCARCGLAVAEEALGFVFDGLRGGSGVIELPAAPAPRMDPKVADDVAHQRLAALRRKGVKRVTFADFRDLIEITGRTRPWVYGWLDERVKEGDLIKEKTPEGVGYVFAY
jgi:hypothetical protein